jgi:hypothetical protein
VAIRTTPEDVESVLKGGNDYRPGADFRPYMKLANVIVNRVIAAAIAYDITPLTSEEAAIVETWLAAWAYKASDQQYQSHSGKTSASFRGQSGMGLEMNNYGQAAMEADSTGLLSNRRAVVGTGWLGKPIQDMLPWNERNWNA